ncbi:MAG: hypothetical protein DCC67_19515 [Planctomycetota bacterium]|nr:MAG: hypothetical protein DCC67_19515 [Planctomycetota bacterium]
MAIAFALVGCQAEQPQPTAATAPEASATENQPTTEVERELAKLPPEDRAQAAAQKICPVSEQPLGSMGTPIKVTVGDKSFFICCDGCREDAEKNFAQHSAKLEGE